MSDLTASTSDPTAIVRRCFQAYVDGDRAAGADRRGFAFSSPLDNRIDRTAYFARCWPNHRSITGFAFHRLLAHGETVFVTYECESAAGRGFRNTEVMTVRDGRIVEVEVYFGWSLPHDAPPGGFVDR